MEMEKSMQETMELIKAETLKSIKQETQQIKNEIDEYNSYLEELVKFIKSVYKEFTCICGGVDIVTSGRYSGETTSGYIQISFCQNCDDIRCIHIKPRLYERGLYDINYYYHDKSKKDNGNGNHIDIYRVLYGMERSCQLYKLNIGMQRSNLLDLERK